MKKLIAVFLAALMLAGCGMPEIDFNGAESPLFKKDESQIARADREPATESSAMAVGKDTDSKAADSTDTDSKAAAGKAGKKTESSVARKETESSPTESGVAAGSTKNDTAGTAAPVQLAVDRISAYDFEYDEKNDVMYLSSDIQYLSLDENGAVQYEKLADRLEKLSDETLAAGEDTFAELLPEAKKAFLDDGSDFVPYEIHIQAVPVRTDSHIFSYFEKTQIKGGDGSVKIAAHTLDSETGRELSLSKVLSDTSSLPEILAKKQKESYPDISEDLFMDKIGGYKDADYVWTLGYDGITFYFEEEGEILALTILRGEEKELFGKTGQQIPESYAFGFDMTQALTFDADGDGRPDTLTIEERENEDGVFEGVTVTLNKKKSVANFYCFAISPAYVHTADGDYIYLFCTEDGDEHQLNIFSLEDGSPSYIGYMDNVGRAYRNLDSTDLSCEVIMTDPDAFDLSSGMDILSTYGASRSYYVGANGMPKSDDTYYYATGELVLTNSKAIKVNIVNERGRVTKKNQTIKAGTKWTLLRTDGVSTVDLVLADKRIARVVLDSVKWPQTIDGEDITELFEGVMFAG